MGHAILHFLWAQTWCAILVIAFIGWGRLILKCLVGEVSSIGLAACIGLSAAVFVGGLLNIFQLITGWILICFTLIGVGLAVGQIIRLTGKHPPSESAAVLSAWRGGHLDPYRRHTAKNAIPCPSRPWAGSARNGNPPAKAGNEPGWIVH